MFHPVGNHATSVYWRRRFMLIASLVVVLVLMVLTVRAMSSGATGSRALGAGSGAPGPGTHPSPHTTSRAASSTASSRRATHSRHRNATQSRHSSSVSSDPTTSAPPAPCVAKNLDVQAVVARPTYKVGQHPEVELQVTDVGAAPCVQDLADKQVVLKVYNGESRVWGSHDCQIEPGTDDRTLEVGSPVRVSIVWSGLTSRPGCAGTRQRVGAGTYTLYAALSGHSGKATQFSIT